ncbi:MAG: hypothetical protein HY674_02650 [Chloroflexi bacterium]|nr:hypothetical protein [Chloroflexota bacterium]
MLDQINITTQPAGEWRGDVRGLAVQIGSAEGLAALSGAALSFQRKRINCLPALRHFLQSYQEEILVPHELPAIRQAFYHASRNELRELVALDQRLRQEPALQNLSGASQLIGQIQLRRLHPLHDQRLVRRYWQAVQRGEARGWHTIVYGMVLALFSLPLRQGLLHYGQQTMHGFLESAGRTLELPENEGWALRQELCSSLPEAVEHVLAQDGPVDLRIV